MVNKSLAALVMVAHDIDVRKTFTPTYFILKGLGPEGKILEEKGFIEIITKDREKSYSITSIGKKILNELDEYYEIVCTEHAF